MTYRWTVRSELTEGLNPGICFASSIVRSSARVRLFVKCMTDLVRNFVIYTIRTGLRVVAIRLGLRVPCCGILGEDTRVELQRLRSKRVLAVLSLLLRKSRSYLDLRNSGEIRKEPSLLIQRSIKSLTIRRTELTVIDIRSGSCGWRLRRRSGCFLDRLSYGTTFTLLVVAAGLLSVAEVLRRKRIRAEMVHSSDHLGGEVRIRVDVYGPVLHVDDLDDHQCGLAGTGDGTVLTVDLLFLDRRLLALSVDVQRL